MLHLARSDYTLFPNLKTFHVGKKYRWVFKVIAATNAYFAELNELAYRDGIKALKYYRNKFIELERDYVEK